MEMLNKGTMYEACGPNVEQILVHAYRIIRGKVPASVRAELRLAVKLGQLGHLKKDGLKPEIYFHPDHKTGAIDAQKRELEYGLKCLAGVMVSGRDVYEAEHGAL